MSRVSGHKARRIVCVSCFLLLLFRLKPVECAMCDMHGAREEAYELMRASAATEEKQPNQAKEAEEQKEAK